LSVFTAMRTTMHL